MLFELILPSLAAAAPSGAGGADMTQMVVFMLLFFAFFYFMMIRPQQKKAKERKAMLEAVKAGDRVQFGGGIIGTVSNVKENVLIIRIADGVKVEVARFGVTQVLDNGEDPKEDDNARR